jgi:hypothetical protein
VYNTNGINDCGCGGILVMKGEKGGVMTCEIAVMNREAVALAADSAETVFGRKVFRSAEKLFAFANKKPIGIMIYGDADISGVPWETVVKRYRDELGIRTFKTLEEYGSNLIDFVEKNENGLIPGSAQERYMSMMVKECFESIVEDIDGEVGIMFYGKVQVTENRIKRIAVSVVDRYYNAINGVDMYPSIPANYEGQIRDRYNDKIENIIKEVFEEFPILDINDKLKSIAVNIFTHDIRKIESSGIYYFDEYEPTYSSGIVIAGFGDTDTFPSVVTYEIEGMLLNHLKYVRLEEKSKTVSLEESPAEIVPFAQVDMVEQFLYGVDSRFDSYLIRGTMNSFRRTCYENIHNDRKLTEEDKKRIHKKFSRRVKSLREECVSNALLFQLRNHYLPIMRVLSILPKDELATMAETLVNLTTFKRRVSTSSETVGGPIDVAIISRGDGFVWVKRKRYFPAELNPGYVD